MKSIMQYTKECYYTGKTEGLHKHHIFFGLNRKKSEEYGCWVWLTAVAHNASKASVHFNRKLDLKLKRDCQRAFEELHGHEKFMQVFGRNYL